MSAVMTRDELLHSILMDELVLQFGFVAEEPRFDLLRRGYEFEIALLDGRLVPERFQQWVTEVKALTGVVVKPAPSPTLENFEQWLQKNEGMTA